VGEEEEKNSDDISGNIPLEGQGRPFDWKLK
jgi:hypothetical protein